MLKQSFTAFTALAAAAAIFNCWIRLANWKGAPTRCVDMAVAVSVESASDLDAGGCPACFAHNAAKSGRYGWSSCLAKDSPISGKDFTGSLARTLSVSLAPSARVALSLSLEPLQCKCRASLRSGRDPGPAARVDPLDLAKNSLVTRLAGLRRCALAPLAVR